MSEYGHPERRSWYDIYHGMMFYFVPEPDMASPYFAPIDPDIDRNVPWTVVTKEHIPGVFGSKWKLLLLGPDSTLVWHDAQLGWIRRVADPVSDEYEARVKLLNHA